MPLFIGMTYQWNEILAKTGSVAGPVFYLLHRPGTQTITAACLDISVNPRAPYEIWPAKGPRIREWADLLVAQSLPFDVFVRETDDQYYYRGNFICADSSSDKKEITLRSAQVKERAVYKILFLKSVGPLARSFPRG